MLTIFKKSERNLNATQMLSVFRQMNYQTKHIGEFDKWKEANGIKYQAKINVYQINMDDKIAYVMADNFDRFMNPFTEDKKEIMNWLKEKGYKTDKQWYMEDCGMTEDLWNEWNKGE